jgi:hypothetical protein
MTKKKLTVITVARKAGDGRFTTIAYANRHKATTEIEHYRRPRRKAA